ncbi:MAG: glycosyltransferase family 8 protein [Acetobacteraceae bacterium]
MTAVGAELSAAVERAADQAEINILACANRSYMQHLAVMLVSMVTNTPDWRFNVVVVCGAGAWEQRDKLAATMARFPAARVSIRTFTPEPGLLLPTPAAYSQDIYTRLWVGEFFAPEVDRVLYLDSDMVVVGDIGPLWEQDLGGKLLGAVDIPGSNRPPLLGMAPEHGYFNSGLLLIDLARWRRIAAQERVLSLVRQRGTEFRDPDQDALNLAFCEDRTKLDYKWNAITPFYRDVNDMQLAPAVTEAVRNDARIVHFNGISRPWSYHNRHPRKADYYKYLAMTEWRDFKPLDRTPFNIARKHLGPMLPNSAKRLLRPLLG